MDYCQVLERDFLLILLRMTRGVEISRINLPLCVKSVRALSVKGVIIAACGIHRGNIPE